MFFTVTIFRGQDKKDDILLPPRPLMQVVRQLVLPQPHRARAGFSAPAQGGLFLHLVQKITGISLAGPCRMLQILWDSSYLPTVNTKADMLIDV